MCFHHKLSQFIYYLMSTKESVHSARSGHSTHSNEESLLVDTDHDKSQKKKTLWMGIIMIIIFLAMAVAVFFAIYQSSKLKDAENERDKVKATKQQKVAQIQDLKVHKVLNLKGIGLKDITIGILGNGSSTIKGLNLEKNNIEQFNAFTLPNLEQLFLNDNPLTHFSNNTFTGLSQITMPGKSLLDFDGNNIPKIQTLDLSQHQGLISFENNRLDNMINFKLTNTLVDFNGNYLPKSSSFNLSSLASIQTFQGNFLNVEELIISSPKLKEFRNNTFPVLKNAVINQSDLVEISFQNSVELTSLTINGSPKLSTLTLINLPKLSNLKVDVPNLNTLIIDNIDMKSFPGDIKDSPIFNLMMEWKSIKTLIIKNSPIENVTLNDFGTLQSLQLQNLKSLKNIDFIEGQQNNIQSILLDNVNLTEFSHHQFPDLQTLILKDNFFLSTFSNNEFQRLKVLQIIGKTVLQNVQSNVLENLQNITITDSQDAVKLISVVPKRYLKMLTLINSPIGNFNFTQYTNLTSLTITNDDSITSISITNSSLFTQLTLDLNNLETLILQNTSIVDQFFLKTPLLQTIVISDTPLTKFSGLTSNKLKSINLKNTNIKQFLNNSLSSVTQLVIDTAPLINLNLQGLPNLIAVEVDRTDIAEFPNVILPQVTNVTLLDNNKLLVFDSTLIPNLQHLIINSDKTVGLQTMILNKTHITSFEYNISSLKNLYLYDNPVLSSFVNSNLPSLQLLSIVNTPITTFSSNTFGSLKIVNLKNISLQSLPVFDSNIRQLYLDSNSLQAVNLNLFTKLQVFETTNNKISHIKLEQLPNLTNVTIFQKQLVQLKLYNTGVSALRLITPSLQNATIQNTPITNFTNNFMLELQTLVLNNNKLTSYSGNTLNGVQTLVIMNNLELKQIKWTNEYYVHNLRIQNTSIESFEPGQILINVTNLILRNNAISDFIIQTMPKLSSLILEENLVNIQIQNTNLSSFSDFELQILETLILKDNPNLDTFQNNTLPYLYKLTLTNSIISNNKDNSFPELDSLVLTNCPQINLVALIDSDSVTLQKLQSLTLENVNVNLQTFYFNNFTSLSFLKLTNIEITNISISNIPLKVLILNLPTLVSLTLKNVQITDNRFENVQNLKYLEITNSPKMLKFNNQSLPSLQTLKLINNNIVTITQNTFNKLNTITIQDQKTTTINIPNAIPLQSATFNTPALSSLILNAPLSSEFLITSVTALSVLYLTNYQRMNLTLDGYISLTELQLVSSTLTFLNITGSPKLTTLRNSSIGSLITLEVTNTAVSSLGLDLPVLTSLTVINDTADSLSLPIAPSLAKLVLKNVNISSLDLSIYPQISEISVSTANLTVLFIQNNHKITTLTGIPLNNLRNLSVIGTLMTDFSLVQLPQAISVRFINNNISTFQENNMPKIQQLILNQNSLIDLILTHNTLTSLNINSTSLTSISLYDTPITSLRNVIAPALQTLQLNNVDLQDNDSIPLLDHLIALQIKSSKISSLNFSKVPVVQEVQLDECHELKSFLFEKNSDSLQILEVMNSPQLNNLSINNMPNLQTLNLDNVGSITMVTTTFSKLEQVTLKNTDVNSLAPLTIPNLNKMVVENSNLSNIGDCYTWSNIDLLSISNTKVASVNCSNTPLISIYLDSSPIVTVELDNCAQLTNIDLSNILIPSFSSNNLSKVEMISLLNLSNLTNISGNKFPALEKLEIKNAILLTSIDSANSNYSKLQTLSIEGSPKYNQVFNYTNFPQLIQLELIETNVPEVNLASPTQRVTVVNYNQTCNMSKMSFQTNSKVEYLRVVNTKLPQLANITIKQMETIYLNDNPEFKKYENNTFSDLTILDLSSTKIQTYTNNISPKLLTLSIVETPLKDFKSNSFDLVSKVELRNNNLQGNFSQAFPKAKFLNLQNNNISGFSGQLNTNFKIIQTLMLSSNGFQTFNNYNSSTLSLLELGNNKNLKEFTNNDFGNLTILELVNCDLTSFSSNKIQNLSSLFLAGNTGYDGADLVDQLNGIKLSQISWKNTNISQSIKNATLQLFPGLKTDD